MRPEEFLKVAKEHPECASVTVPACIRYCEAVWDNACSQWLLEVAENASVKEGTADALFFAWKTTKDARYEKAILEEGRKALDTVEDLAEVYKVHPFFMAYDTAYAKKEHYAKVAQIFKSMDLPIGWNMAALIDVISVMSPEIYEHYRMMQDLFRTKIKEAAEKAGGFEKLTKAEPLERAIAGYVILQACENRTLLAEKYQEYGVALWESVKDLDEAWNGSNVALQSMCMELYAKIVTFM
ncbi:MAG: hypothetical protein Q4E24_15120 [bacterium]|nr:hypothetical protein [bacterium]